MKLTPLDIRKQEFSRGFRGFDAEEVHAFLQMVADQWQEILDEKARLEERLREQEMKLQHYMKVEEALEQALKTARETSRQTIENAERRAQLMIKEAEAQAEEIKRDALEERQRLRQEAAQIAGRRKEIATRLRAFLLSEMEMLAHFEGEDPTGFIKLLPAEGPAVSERFLAGPGGVEAAPAGAEEASTGEPATGDAVEVVEMAAETPASEPDEPGDAVVPGGPSASATQAATGPEAAEEARPEAEEEAMPETTRQEPEERPLWQQFQAAAEEGNSPDAGGEKGDAPADRPGWRVRNLVMPGSEPGPAEHTTPAPAPPEPPAEEDDTHIPSDEIAKIRRILDDLD